MLNNLPENLKDVSGIYIIRNTVNAKVYIGSSVRIRTRYRSHRSSLVTGKHVCRPLQNFAGKYGMEVLQFHLLELCPKEQLLDRENELIVSHCSNKPAHGFNLRLHSSSNLGLKHDAASRENMTKASLNKPKSEAHRQNIGLAKVGNKSRKGQKNSEAQNAAISAGQLARPAGSQRGRVFSAEHRQKLSAAATGIPKAQAHKAALSAAQKGAKRSAESVAKSAASRRGLKLSPETIAKRTATRKRNQERVA